MKKPSAGWPGPLTPILLLVITAAGSFGVIQHFTIGRQPDGSIVIPTGQLLQPAGTHIHVNDRPLGLAVSPDGKLLAVATGLHAL